MARITQKSLDSILAAVIAGETKIEDTPTFEHEVKGITFTAHVVKRDATSGRYNLVAKVEDGVVVKDNTFVGNDKTAKDGLYRIDKVTDQEQQAAWRAKRAEMLAQAAEAQESGEEVVEEDNAPAPRKRTRKQSAA
jgi:hypothetical protein